MTVVQRSIDLRIVLSLTLLIGCATRSASAQMLSEISDCRDVSGTTWLAGSSPRLFSGEGLLAVSGTTAYVGSRTEPLISVVDFSNPANPLPVGSIVTSGPVTALSADSAYLLAAVEGAGLFRYDLTDPADPAQDLTMSSTASVSDLVQVGQFVFLAMGAQGIGVVTMEVPGFLFLVTTINTGGRVSAVASADGLLLAVDSLSGMLVYDVVNPAGPVFLSATTSTLIPKSVDVGFGRAVLTARPTTNDYATVTLFDLTDPSDPGILAGRTIPSRHDEGPFPTLRAADRVLVIQRDDDEFDEINGVSEFVHDGPQLLVSGFSRDLGNQRLVVTDEWLVGLGPPLQVNIAPLGELPPSPLARMDLGGGRSIASGNLIYLTGPLGLQILDLTDATSPEILSELTIAPGPDNFARPVAYLGSQVYLGSSDGGIVVVDATDSEAPGVVTTLPPWDAPIQGLLREGNTLYGVTAMDGLVVYDLTVPALPVVSGYSLPTDVPFTYKWVPSMAILGDRVFVEGFGGGGVNVFDVSDPTRPALIGQVGSYVVESLAVTDDGRLLVSFLGATGLTFFSETSPDNWVQTGNLAGIKASAMTVEENLVYANTGHSVLVIDLSGAEPIRHIGEFSVWGDMTLLPHSIFANAFYEEWGAQLVLPRICLAGVSGVPAELPTFKTMLAPAWPNPFNPQTTLSFRLPDSGWARLVVHDLNGQRVRILWDGVAARGETRVTWDGTDDMGQRVASGAYLVRLEAGERIETRKVALLK